MASKLNILIADDEMSLRSSLRNILEMKGYNTAETKNGLEAVESRKEWQL